MDRSRSSAATSTFGTVSLSSEERHGTRLPDSLSSAQGIWVNYRGNYGEDDRYGVRSELTDVTKEHLPTMIES